MNRISIQKSNGKIIEMQSGGDTEDTVLANARLDTLKQNAINNGFAESDIEVKWISDQDYAELEKAQKDSLTYYESRKLAYPSIADQLDTIFHSGIDAWKAEIQAVKVAYPKDI
jgi:hypothetical protein